MDDILAGRLPNYAGKELRLTMDDLRWHGFRSDEAFCKAILCLDAHYQPRRFNTDAPVVLDNRWLRLATSKNYHHTHRQFSGRRDAMGLPSDAVLHSTRHTALTDLGAAGADAFTIQAVAGHSSVTTSQRYVHPVPEPMIRAIARLDAYQKVDAERRRPKLEIMHSGPAPATVSATRDTSDLVSVDK